MNSTAQLVPVGTDSSVMKSLESLYRLEKGRILYGLDKDLNL